MVGLDPTVQGAERRPAGQTVRGQQTIEGIPGPVQGKRLVDEAKEGYLVHHEPGVLLPRVQEPFVVQDQPGQLGSPSGRYRRSTQLSTRRTNTTRIVAPTART